MTRFPLDVRGELDADAVTRMERPAFDAALRRMLAQDSGVRAARESVATFLKRYSQPAATDIAPDGASARVGDFEFEHLDTEWRLVRIYLQGGHQ
jgi:hypothetical protein